MNLFDSHAHMDDRRFDDDRAELLSDFPRAGIRYLMNAACDLDSSKAGIRLSGEYDYIYCAVGSHPDDADHVDEARIEIYRRLAAENSKVKAIGEIGLDYHYEDVPREIQQKAFRMQMHLAKELGLPVIVHEREAHADGLMIVDEFPEVRGVFHCFSGSAEFAMELVRRGWYIGFTGVLTFKNARRAVEAAQAIPLDRILIETDCPYMAPEPFRGRRCDPRLVRFVAKKLGEIRSISEEEAAEVTMQNACRLFDIHPETQKEETKC